MNDRSRSFSSPLGPIFPATTALTGLHALAFLAAFLFANLQGQLLLSPHKLFTDKQFWLLATSVFWFQPRVAEAALFLVGFVLLGVAAERNLGSRWFAALYTIGAMLTALFWAISAATGIGSEQELNRGLLLTFPPGAGVLMGLALIDRPLASIRVLRILPVPVWLIVVAWLTLEFRYFGLESYPVSFPTLLYGAFSALMLRRFRDSETFARLLNGSWRSAGTAIPVAPNPETPPPNPDADGELPFEPILEAGPDPELDAKVDELLRKIAEFGADSLSEDEIQVLLKASERYRQRKEGD